MYLRGYKHNVSSKFFPFESVNSHERITLSQKQYKMKQSKLKSRKKARIIQLDGNDW